MKTKKSKENPFALSFFMEKIPTFDSTPYWVKKHNETINLLNKLEKNLKAKINAFDKEGTSRFWNDDAHEEMVNPKLRLAK